MENDQIEYVYILQHNVTMTQIAYGLLKCLDFIQILCDIALGAWPLNSL